ncbi:MAG: hypothetical protein K1060chlam4_01166 [Candidatus Anoxychlamydiales bacterium]|nr:hypothetical protein [Candidatus Anoxychlamydiales bacterium]
MSYFSLPKVHNIITNTNIEIKSSDKKNDPTISKTLYYYMSRIKKQIEQHADSWDNTKKYTNPYEYIHTTIPNCKTAICKLKPFVGNKRKEIVSNPIYYFIDNGFRNQALRSFSKDENRNDMGLLIESAVFQEILKFREQNFYDFDIHFWRTQSGAEVDFVLYKTDNEILPIEVKYSRMKKPMITRSFRSFIEAYKPKEAIVISKNFKDKVEIEGTTIHFIPFKNLIEMFDLIQPALSL